MRIWMVEEVNFGTGDSIPTPFTTREGAFRFAQELLDEYRNHSMVEDQIDVLIDTLRNKKTGTITLHDRNRQVFQIDIYDTELGE